MKRKPVMVTTQHRGVFFGYAKGALKNGTVTITQARNCLYWSADVKGFMGLAANGPTKGCRVGPAVASLTLTGVTSVSRVSTEAEQKWVAAPWS